VATDADLATRIGRGDQSAFDSVFRRYEGRVRSMATRVLREPSLAEDVVQETFVGCWDSPDKFDPSRGTLQSFLLTIAPRRAIDLVRSEVSRTRRESAPPEPSHFDVADEVLSQELSSQVRVALANLAPGE
jgi:RNA polymerase sigma-70 factor (ECF subfamily)